VRRAVSGGEREDKLNRRVVYTMIAWCISVILYEITCVYVAPQFGVPGHTRMDETFERCWFGCFGMWIGSLIQKGKVN
jgi:hypothetical protein